MNFQDMEQEQLFRLPDAATTPLEIHCLSPNNAARLSFCSSFYSKFERVFRQNLCSKSSIDQILFLMELFLHLFLDLLFLLL